MTPNPYGWIMNYRTGSKVRPATFDELVRSLENAQTPEETGVFRDPEADGPVYVDYETCVMFDVALREARARLSQG